MTWRRLDLDTRDLSAGYECWTRERTVSVGAVIAWMVGLAWLVTMALYAVAP